MSKLSGFFILLVLVSGACAPSGNSVMKNTAKGNSAVKNTAPANDEKPVASDARPYGEKVKYSQNAPVKFADFTLTYAGQRTVNAEKIQRPFTYYDFKAENGGEQAIVSWSSGLGEIGPVPFEIGGKKYELELRISDQLGTLDQNELVVWKK